LDGVSKKRKYIKVKKHELGRKKEKLDSGLEQMMTSSNAPTALTSIQLTVESFKQTTETGPDYYASSLTLKQL
jgi:hypothetical protein